MNKNPCEEHSCPLCGKTAPVNPRYPNCVCSSCINLATDEKGRKVQFNNESLSGGIKGQYSDSGTPYREATCFINSIECFVEEAHLGGVVIFPVI